MSPSQASSDEFPRLTGADNFDVWKTRVRVALDGKHLLGFVKTKDHNGVSDDEDKECEESEASDMSDVEDEPTLNAKPAKEQDPPEVDYDDSDEELKPPSDSGSEVSGKGVNPTPKRQDLPKIRPFNQRDTKREAKALKPKALSARELRRLEAKTKAFLIKTMDNTHVRLVKDLETSFEIFQAICEKYEGVSSHGDPYFIQGYLMKIKYEEGSDLTDFFIKLEQAMDAASSATESVMTDGQKSLYLFHAMPETWKHDLNVWKGRRKYIPYNELKVSIEAKVREIQAQQHYTMTQGTPESKATKAEKALAASAVSTALSAQADTTCSYCSRPRHTIRLCRTLQRDLREGNVKAGTILPANFAFRGGDNKREHPYRNKHGERGRSRSNGNGNSYRSRQERGNSRKDRPSDDNRKKFTQERRESGMIAVTVNTSMPISLAAQATVSPEPSWTIDSGCTRHVTHEAQWFTTMAATRGSITVGGKNTIPIEGTGQVEMEVTDSKGKKKTLILHDVLFAPQLKFSLFSVPAAVKHDFRFSFDRKKCAVQTDARFKIKAMMANHADLYQFQATPAVKAKVLIAKSGKQSSMMLLHKRLGHPNVRILHNLPRNQTITGLDEEAVNPRAQFFCTACTLAKSHRSPFNSNRIVERAQYPLEKVHTDIGGPLPVPSLTGCRYFLIFIDDFSRYMFTYPIKSRSQVYECYEDFRRKALNIFRRDVNVLEYPRPSEESDSQPEPQSSIDEWEIQVLQADNAKEYEKLGRKIFQKYGTHAQFTNAYTPQQNGVAERRMRTIMERVRALLLDGNLPKQLWAECVRHVTTLINITPSVKTEGTTPYELWYDRKPSMEYLKVFGCSAYVHITEQYRDKLDARARLCMYVGIPDHKKGYRLMDVNTHAIIYSRDVIFKEDEFPRLTNLTPREPVSHPRPEQTEILAPPPATTTTAALPILPPLREALKRSHFSFSAETPNEVFTPTNKKPRFDLTDTEVTLDEEDDLQEREQRKTLLYTLLAIRYVTEPTRYRAAMKSTHANRWHKAAKAEYNSLMENNTWVLVPPPKGRTILTSRWVFVVKYTGTGEIDRFKARLVIKGFLQEYGIDYNEIFSLLAGCRYSDFFSRSQHCSISKSTKWMLRRLSLTDILKKGSTWLNQKVLQYLARGT
ncbi:unnamed protein product [Phytophthora fragariaefolia]|uniref:Unnamed protein product n=1 Tax=Phytophthora fragariaefolia TaxID=1490495 RepID=A0A9W6U582_9STRA|nr:unnamed protein product [Phytophthora fragariaefolia]